MNADLDDVIRAVREGRVEAYAAVVRRHQEEVWRIAAYALRDASETEELVQRVFVQAYTKLGSYQLDRDFGAWLRTIARNMAREELRERERESRRLAAYREHLAARFDEPASAEDRQEKLRQALARCRGELAPAAARAVELRYEQALDFEAVARDLGRTVAAARQLLGRVRLNLRRCIEQRASEEVTS
jgi:RNA polymerase sigma-70 factor, ECF subfamily